MADKGIFLNWGALTGACSVLIGAVAGTYALTNLATQSHVAALQLQASSLDTRVRELQGELVAVRHRPRCRLTGAAKERCRLSSPSLQLMRRSVSS